MTRGFALLVLLAACAPAVAPPNGAKHDHHGVYVKLHAVKGAPLAVLMEEEGPQKLGAPVATALERRGIAVAVMTFERGLEPSKLALVLEDLHRDADRIVLVGHGAGADAAAALALDRTLTKAPIAGVLGLRGTYASLAPRVDAPPFLLLSAANDDTARAQAARRFARSLEAAGAKDVESYLVPEHDAKTLASWSDEDALSALVVSFIKRGTEPRSIDGPFGAKQIWGRSPPLAYDTLWKNDVATRPIDATFRAALDELFGEVAVELAPWPLVQYHALPLEKWLASRPVSEIGMGDHLVTTNIRGERFTMTRKDVADHQPVLVIGIDDEKNLHRMFTRYRVNQEYSWKPRAPSDDPMPLMIRPVGPFLFFPKGTPPHLRDTTLATFALTADSFRFVKDDPLASARKLPPDLQAALTGNDGCLKCHALKGAGAKAHHIRASDGKENGGFALALDEYSPDILRRFLFDQETVAAGFGVAPLRVSEPTAKALFALVQKK